MSKKNYVAEKTGAVTSSPLLLPLSITLALLPVIMLPYAVDMYALPKITFLYVATLMLISLYLFHSIRAGKFVIFRSALDIPIALMLISAAVSVILADAPLLGLIGKYRRYESLLSVACYAVLYFITIQSVRDKKSFERLLKTMSLGFIFVMLYGILQVAGIDFSTISRFESRIHSSLGNPILLGTYIVIMTPLLLSLAGNDEEEKWRMLAWSLVFIGFINLLYTESRGAWLGLFAALMSLVCIRIMRSFQSSKAAKQNRKHPKRSHSKNQMVFMALGLLLFLALISFIFISPGGNHLKERLISTFAFSEGSAATRIETWKAVIAMVADRPFYGYGLEQLGYWFPAFKTPLHVRIAPIDVADRAHNDFLQVAVDMGLPGLLLYVWMFLIALMGLFRQGIPKQKTYLTGLLSSIIGYLSQSITGIPAVFISPIVWVLLAATVNLTAPANILSKAHVITVPKWLKSSIILPTIVIVFFALAALSIRPVAADVHMREGKELSISSMELAAGEFETALKLFPYQTQYAKDAAEFYLDYASNLQSNVFARRASLIAEQGLNYNKRDFELAYYVAEASFLEYRLTENEISLSKAEEYYERTVELWPTLSLAKSRLFEIASIKGDSKKATALAEQLIETGNNDPRFYYMLAIEAQKNGEQEKATQYLRKVKALDPGFLLRSR